jgi:hypothetical protein
MPSKLLFLRMDLKRQKNIYVAFVFSLKLCYYAGHSISIYLSMALQPFVEPWPLFQFRDPTHSQ